MNTSDILNKVRKIEIKTKGLSNHIFAGQYNTAFKGKGMTFSEVREYCPGDDVRTIDWNVTARYNNPHVKIFEEERELTMILMIDISKSSSFGTQIQTKKDLSTEIASILAFSAINNNDKVGIVLFTDKIEKFIPPKKGKQHILRIIRELITFQPDNNCTNLENALKYLNDIIKKRAICFIISDFIDNSNYEKPIRIAKKRHDLIAIKINDKLEKKIPNIGLLEIEDSESNERMIIDTSDKTQRNDLLKNFIKHDTDIRKKLTKNGINHISLNTGEDYVFKMLQFFKKRK
ncbi:MAG: DUF58 domain-containing protein [Flavobacteriales bacterium]|nr:DUF58 domain-containing protein [Flavobacteriales bacterium]|tara:strand:- start:744 stop:1613 length:870 start_codon:yes stop_codon:yes gene_type:complete